MSPRTPIGLPIDLMFDEREIGDGSTAEAAPAMAVNATAVHATIRQRELSRWPLGKSSRMKRSPPAGKIRMRTQFESHAAQSTAGSAVEPLSPRIAYPAPAARAASRTPTARNNHPTELARPRETTSAPTAEMPSGTSRSGPTLLLSRLSAPVETPSAQA